MVDATRITATGYDAASLAAALPGESAEDLAKWLDCWGRMAFMDMYMYPLWEKEVHDILPDPDPDLNPDPDPDADPEPNPDLEPEPEPEPDPNPDPNPDPDLDPDPDPDADPNPIPPRYP